MEKVTLALKEQRQDGELPGTPYPQAPQFNLPRTPSVGRGAMKAAGRAEVRKAEGEPPSAIERARTKV